MNAREEILTRLGEGMSRSVRLQARTRTYPDLAVQFAEALQRAKGETVTAPSEEGARQAVSALIEELGVKRAVAHREGPLAALGIPDAYPEVKWSFAGETRNYRQDCERADLGVTSALYGLAETGSLVVTSGAATARMTSLLPPVHLALVPRSRLLPSIFEWQPRRPDPLPANLVLISGPSKTADIEQTLIVGVHGPKRLVVVIYPD